MAVQFTPLREIDDQAEIDRLQAERRSAGFRDDGGTLEWRARQRLGRLAFMWFGIRIVFWLPGIVTMAAVYWFPLWVIAGAVFGPPWSPDHWGVALVGACYLTATTLRRMRNIWAGPLVLEARFAPRNLLEATAGGLRNGLMSLYSAYVLAFYGVGVLVIVALLQGPTGPLVPPS